LGCPYCGQEDVVVLRLSDGYFVCTNEDCATEFTPAEARAAARKWLAVCDWADTVPVLNAD
jgi:hypothetical protein